MGIKSVYVRCFRAMFGMFYLQYRIQSHGVFLLFKYRGKEVRTAFSVPVSSGVTRFSETDSSFPSAHSSYNHKLALLLQHLDTSVLELELISLASWEGSSAWDLHR